MQKVIIDNDLHVYQFLVNPETGYSINIAVVFNGDDFVLIDTGYEAQMEELMKELDFSRCKFVFFSHQHPDHTFGAKLLDNVELVGHMDYETGFNECVEWMNITDWTIEGTVPTRFMEDKEKLVFGKHTFTFIHHPYHTSTHMLIDLNNEYLFTGDEILTTFEGGFFTSIYFAPTIGLEESYTTLRRHIKGKTVISGHGIVNLGDAEDRIKDHELYLSLVREGCAFSNLHKRGLECKIYNHFHDYNLKHHTKDR